MDISLYASSDTDLGQDLDYSVCCHICSLCLKADYTSQPPHMDDIRLLLLKFAKLFAVLGLLSGIGGQYTNAKYFYYPAAAGADFSHASSFALGHVAAESSDDGAHSGQGRQNASRKTNSFSNVAEKQN